MLEEVPESEEDLVELSLLELAAESDLVSGEDFASLDAVESDEGELSVLLSTGGLGLP